MHKKRAPHHSLLGTARLGHPPFATGEDCSLSKETGGRRARTGKPFLYAVLTSRGFQLKSIPKVRLDCWFLRPCCYCPLFLENKENVSLFLYMLPSRIRLPYFLAA